MAFPIRPSLPLTARGGFLDKYFYFATSLLLVAIVLWGFGHTVNDALFHPAIPRPWLLWLHSAAFSGWLLLYVLQTGLVRTRRIAWHRTVGWFVVGVGAAMVPLGVTTALVMGRFDLQVLHQPGSDTFEFISFGDMAIFTVWLVLGILWRKKPRYHRPAFYIATCGLAGAAFGRVPYIATHNLMYICVDAVIALGIARDLIVDHHINRVYLYGALPLALAQYGIVYMISTPPQWWIHLAHRFV